MASTNIAATESGARVEVHPRIAVHLLDVGPEEYGDAVLCQLGAFSVLIDGAHPGNWRKEHGHPSVQGQVARLLGQQGEACTVDLLIVTHAHADHIGCLPALVEKELLSASWALVADPEMGWGRLDDEVVAVSVDARARAVLAALREEARSPDAGVEEVEELTAEALRLEDRYSDMLKTLADRGCNVIRYGRDDARPLVDELRRRGIGLDILGPRREDLRRTAEMMVAGLREALANVEVALEDDNQSDATTLYHETIDRVEGGSVRRVGHYVNLQSIVTLFTFAGKKLLFTGDMQLSDPETNDPGIVEGLRILLEKIARSAPYDFVKLPHHGSYNGLSKAVIKALRTPPVVGICAGERSKRHPALETIRLLERYRDRITWARTDRNGETSITFDHGAPTIAPTTGELDDASPPGPAGESAEVAAESAPPEVAPPVDTVEISTKVPHRATRIAITVEVTFGDEHGRGPSPDEGSRAGGARGAPRSPRPG